MDDKNQINKFGNGHLPNYYSDGSWQRPVEKQKDDKLQDDLWNFKSLVEKVFDSEGGFSNRKNDRGGVTNRGITSGIWKATAKKYLGVEPTLENLKKLTRDDAEKIYFNEYWNKSRAEEVKHGPTRYLLFDFYVNSSPKAAVRNLQRAINQEGGRLQEDGIMGTTTLDALNAHPDPEAVYRKYKQNRIEHYQQIVKDDYRQKENIKGWLNRMENF